MTALAVPEDAGALRRALHDPSLRMLGGAILLHGTFAVSLGVHQSLIATHVFGLSDAAYAVVLALSMVISVGAAVAVGISSDRHPHRRPVALLTAALMLAGTLLVALAPTRGTFLAAHLLLLAPTGSFMGQAFAAVRLASGNHPPESRAGLLALMRALFAVPFVVVLPLWGLVLRDDASLLVLYPALAGVAALLLLLVWRLWPPDASAPWADAKSGLGVAASLRELGQGPILLRTALIGAAQLGGATGGVILGLVFAQAGRPTGDVGLFFGAFVSVEVGVTLLLAPLARRLPRLTLIAIGTALYALYLALLPPLAGSALVWLLILPAGAGGALLYTLTIAYLQDLLRDRAGAGAALVSVQRVSTEGLSTAFFAAGTAVQGYQAVALLAGLGAMLAAVALLRLDGRRP